MNTTPILNEPGKADRQVCLDAWQRLLAESTVPMHDSGIVELDHPQFTAPIGVLENGVTTHELECPVTRRLCAQSAGFIGVLVATLWASSATGLGAEALAQAALPTNSSAPPSIIFEERAYDFGEVKQSVTVEHDFIFTNMGSQTLQVLDVKTGCGCTTAGAWDKEVAPGKTGIIPLQFNSSGFRGQVSKSATVTCNDPKQSNVVLLIAGKVWTPVEVSPPTVVFQYLAEGTNSETRTVNIVNHLPETLELQDPESTNRFFKTVLRTVTPGKEFALDITTIPPLGPGTVSVPIILKTSSTEIPSVRVQAMAIERQSLIVSPTRILLPTSPLTKPLRQSVTIQNFSPDALTLTEPQINLPGLEVQTHELRPGNLFQLSLEFPAGLQLTPEQQVELSVKSSDPKHALIKVPVIQLHPASPTGTNRVIARPAAGAAIPAPGGPVAIPGRTGASAPPQ